ncbi:iron ABC transporter [Amycolatopsis sp. A1MSW2902]|uniref:FecCD family ABC transporter permease n=1 Tax=Amycolatopsis sp. A1MSW2902 TaxID=687413 RepID=UPI00307F8A3F
MKTRAESPARPVAAATKRRSRFRSRPAGVAAVLSVANLVLFLTAAAVSDYPLTLPGVARVLLGGGTRIENAVVLDAQLPRALTAALVGFALGLAGALTQSITRNRLATPDLLGITGGASVGAVLVITLVPAAQDHGAAVPVPVGSLFGAAASTIVMYLLAWRRGINPIRLVIVGLGLTWTTQAIVSLLLTRASITDAARAQQWIVGSVDAATWDALWPLGAIVAFAVVLVPAAVNRRLSVAALGEQLAGGLGMRVSVTYTWILLLAVALAAFSVAAAGPIAFIALLAPPIAMALTGAPTPPPIASGLVGCALILAADLLTRTLLPAGLPVGVTTAGVGGPVLVCLMIRTTRKATV